MKTNRKSIALHDILTDAEIIQTIRYLDPDLWSTCTRRGTQPVLGIAIALIAALTAALLYIGLYVRTL